MASGNPGAVQNITPATRRGDDKTKRDIDRATNGHPAQREGLAAAALGRRDPGASAAFAPAARPRPAHRIFTKKTKEDPDAPQRPNQNIPIAAKPSPCSGLTDSMHP